jgi:hypothetical protein
VWIEQEWTWLDERDIEDPYYLDLYDSNGDGVLDIDEQQTNDDWGEPLAYAPPRRIRLGLKFSW